MTKEDLFYVREYMTYKVITITPNALAADALKIMRQHDIRRLPVIESFLDNPTQEPALLDSSVHNYCSE